MWKILSWSDTDFHLLFYNVPPYKEDRRAYGINIKFSSSKMLLPAKNLKEL